MEGFVRPQVATAPFEAYSGTAAENYERYFVPAIGAPLAARLLRFAALRPGDRVLDVACGTGVVARRAAQQVGSTGRVTGLDANPGMLAVAESLPGSSAIEWRESAAEQTPLGSAAYDIALCQLGLQFFADRHAALLEVRRVLAPGGRLVANVPGPMPPLFEILQRGIRAHLSPEIAKFMSVVFSLDDARGLEELVGEAGFADVSVDRDPTVLRLPPPDEFLWQYVWSTPLADAVVSIDADQRDALKRDVLAEWEPLTQDGALVLGLDVLTVTAQRG